VTLPEPCIAEAMVWAKQGSASDEDMLHVKRARSGFRTGWGVVTAALKRTRMLACRYSFSSILLRILGSGILSTRRIFCASGSGFLGSVLISGNTPVKFR
jgi:hypothetical protein